MSGTKPGDVDKNRPLAGSHPLPTGKRLRSTAHSTLHLQRHRPLDLAKFVIEGFSTPVDLWSRSEKAALTKWKAWLSSWDDMCKANDGNVPSHADMLEAIDLISIVFFCGKLQRTKFEWTPNMCLAADGTHQKSARVGDCGRKDDTSQVYSLIRLDPADLAEQCHGIGVGAENRSRKISVLLHECVHAFIFLYTCEKGCPHANCAANRSYLYGHSGHGLAFLQIATHIEAYHEVLTQIGVTMGIPHGVWTEATTSSEYMGIRPNDFVHCHQSWHVWLKQYYEQALAKKGRDEDEMGLPDILKTMKGFSLEEFSSPEK